MYENGQPLVADAHFLDHLVHEVPVQIYRGRHHDDIGYVRTFSDTYVRVNNTLYRRDAFTFISRPGY